MDTNSLIMFQQYETPEGMKYMIWKVPCEEFQKLAAEYETCCESPNEARRWALTHFVMQKRAELVGVTEQDAELYAANLRESGVAARYVRDKENGRPEGD